MTNQSKSLMNFYDKSVKLYENRKISKEKMKNQVTIKHEIGDFRF